MNSKPNGNGAEEALNVLRDIWANDETSAAEFRELEPRGKICKNTSMLGIKGMEDEGMAEAMRAEWRRQLANDGKISAGSRSIAELIDDGDL
ncbi:MAG: hypothetical protein ACT4QG_04875 [Sporichthyaceae bacterium]